MGTTEKVKGSLSKKIVCLVVATIVIVGAAFFLATYYSLTKGFDKQAQAEISTYGELLQSNIERLKDKLSITAMAIASRPDIAEAITKKNTAYLRDISRDIMKKAGVGFIAVADEEGNVMAQGHSDKTGDTIRNKANVKKAIAGEASVGIEEESGGIIILRAGYPIKKGGAVIGVVAVATDLTSNHVFVDEMKKTIGVECTIFQNDMRVSTTIMKGTERAVGTKMDNQEVIDTVLKKGQHFERKNVILGKEYNTLYIPLKGTDGAITGMLFLGKDREMLNRNFMYIVWFCVLAILLTGGCMTWVGFYFAKTISKPLNSLVIATEKLAVGNMDVQVDTKSTDEVGVLAGSFQKMIETIKMFLEEINTLNEMHSMGENDHNIPTEKFPGMYRDIARGINSAVNIHVENVRKMLGILGSYSEGDFDPVLEKLAGKGARANERLDQLRASMIEVTNIAEKIADGDINITVKERSGNDKLMQAFVKMVQVLEDRGKDVGELIESAINGKLDYRADTSKYRGGHKAAIDGVNKLLDAVVAPLKMVARIVDMIGQQGDIPPLVTETYRGEFEEIKNNLNQLITAMQEVTYVAEQIASGNLTVNVRVRSENDKLMQALAQMVKELGKMITNINAGVQTLSSSSTELVAISGQMSGSADQTSSRSNMVATASEEMSSNMSSVAGAMEETTANINTVATATEEMTATIGEIARNSEKARSITGDAVSQANKITTQVDELGRAAKDIGKVTETISAISAQTNLLALNATIEAARAGVAGKGFAVVANEIKELAQQTAAATEDIKSRIDGIQATTSVAVTDIETISRVIQEVNDIVSGIAAAIEEQSAVTKDIAGNIAQAARGVEEVNHNVAQSSTVSRSIAQEISEVNQASGEISSSSGQVRISAEELSRLAEQLKELVGRYVYRAGTADEAESLVEKAADYLRKNGKEKAFREFNDLKGNFVKGDLYIFAIDTTGLTLAHGGNPKLVGNNMMGAKDADGKLFIKETIIKANEKGNGWSDYKWVNPVTKETREKTTYFRKADDVVLGCGIYKQ